MFEPPTPTGLLPALSGMAPGAAFPGPPPSAGVRGPGGFPVSELVLHTEPVVHRFEEKAGFATVPDYYAVATPAILHRRSSLDSVMSSISRRRCDPTARSTGRHRRDSWRVIRLGYSLTGTRTDRRRPRRPGFEVDKLESRSRPRLHEHFLRCTEDARAVALRRARRVGDSERQIEAGAQNWTDDILEQFTKRRGYDPMPFLPALTGRWSSSAEASDKFL